MSNANDLINYMKKEYIDSGYMYSGCVIPYQISLRFRDVRTRDLIDEALNSGKVQVRNCQGFSIELTREERAKLIKEHGLADIWEKKAPYCYPNGEHGEITSVMSAFPTIERMK